MYFERRHGPREVRLDTPVVALGLSSERNRANGSRIDGGQDGTNPHLHRILQVAQQLIRHLVKPRVLFSLLRIRRAQTCATFVGVGFKVMIQDVQGRRRRSSSITRVHRRR